MPTNKISPKTQKRIDLLFKEKIDREEVARLLIEECGNNLPLLQNLDEHGLERFRFAVLKLSDGELPRLKSALTLAKTDWRDLLVAAEFAEDIKAHELWLPVSKS
jgi:hypothetical protein